MSIKVNHELDPLYETMILLYHGYNMDILKREIINQINEAGSNGEEFYQKNYKTLDKYLRTFQKNCIMDEQDSFYFKDTSTDFYISFITPFFIKRELIHTVSIMNNDQMINLIIQNSEALFEIEASGFSGMTHAEFTQTENLMRFINQFDLSENEKWKMLLILQKPQEYYSKFSELVKKNFPIFEKSLEAIKIPFEKYREKLIQNFETEEKEAKLLKVINLDNCEISELTPAMVSATGIIIMADNCYFGLMAENTLNEFGYSGEGKEYILSRLKALSDRSKFDIVLTLKTSPKYATELAVQLGLTSATVSHHMSTLLATQLVYVQKENGKYYYHVNEDGIQELIEQLQQLLQ